MNKCINCNDKELKNPKAKYCSDKCRMAFKRRAIRLNKKVFGEQPERKTRTQHNPNKQGVEQEFIGQAAEIAVREALGITGGVLPDDSLKQPSPLEVVEDFTTESVTNPCKYCGKQLDFVILECCSDCALKQPTKVSPAQDGHILASRPALEFTGKLTSFESERYKPASELKPGRYNPVSKPGDSHYGQG